MRQLTARRFENGGTNVFAAAADAASAGSAAGSKPARELINLSIGDTDFTTDERIIRAAMADALAGHTHYTDSQGDPELIEAIRDYYREEYAMPVAREEIFVTASSCFGMELALMAMLDPGDEVLLIAPYFTPYREQVQLTGGVPVEVPTRGEEGFSIRREALESAITPRTKAIIVNNPCNPTGAAYDMTCYAMLADVANRHDLFILADEIYTAYMYKFPFVPLRSVPGMAERVVTLNSFSKNYIMTGWRVGYIVTQPSLVRAMKAINENMVYSAPAPSQRAALAALRLRHEIGTKYTDVYRRRVLLAAERINAIPWLSVREPEGTFYLFIDIRATGLDSAAFCRRAREEAGVALVPGSAFGRAGEGYVRMACTVSEDRLNQAFARLGKMHF